MDARAGRQIRPQFPNGGIKARARVQGRPVGGRSLEGQLMPAHQIQQIGMRNLHAFGPAR